MARKSILVVDDEKNQREILETILSGEGYDVTTASSGEAAMKFVADRHFDLVLTDLMMPVMNGRVFVDTLSAEQPALRVIYMSGYTAGALDQELRSSSYLFLQKPFSIEDLANALKAAREREIIRV